MKAIFLVIGFVLLATPYVYNFVKLTDCDFESDYKCEAIHLSGAVIPPLAFITVWFDTDEE